MFISKKKHTEIVDAYEKTIAAMALALEEGQEAHDSMTAWAMGLAGEKIRAEQALATALAATQVALKNAQAETAAADAALARYVTDYAPRTLEPLP